jgi:hypothetical protein
MLQSARFEGGVDPNAELLIIHENRLQIGFASLDSDDVAALSVFIFRDKCKLSNDVLVLPGEVDSSQDHFVRDLVSGRTLQCRYGVQNLGLAVGKSNWDLISSRIRRKRTRQCDPPPFGSEGLSYIDTNNPSQRILNMSRPDLVLAPFHEPNQAVVRRAIVCIACGRSRVVDTQGPQPTVRM